MLQQLLRRKSVEPQSLEALARQEADYGRTLYKLIWVQLWLSMLTQVGGLVPFPTYNVSVAFWGLYGMHAKKSEALITFTGLVILSIILDLAFCGIWANLQQSMFSNGFDKGRDALFEAATSRFCMVMLVFHLLTKLFVVYFTLMFVSASGGPWVLDMLNPDAKKDTQGRGSTRKLNIDTNAKAPSLEG